MTRLVDFSLPNLTTLSEGHGAFVLLPTHAFLLASKALGFIERSKRV